VIYGKLKADIREILRTLCRYKKVEIIEGAVCVDHVHLCVSIPPKLAISEFMGYLKGKSALMIYDRHPELGNKFERDFWARGYYVSTIGNVDEATIRKYIREQEEESYKEARTTK
jgi:putative transposase